MMSMEDMESLLDEDMEFRSLRRGDVLEGIVMETSREGVLVDIGSKSEGIIPLNEMHSLGADPLARVKRGDELLVYVLQPEGNEGQVILSIDRARGEQGWRTLQKRFEDQDSFEGEVTGFNKGGLLVNVEGVNAFVPLSQVVGVRTGGEDGEGLQSNVGRTLRLKVIEINRRRNRVILSERAAMQEYRSQQKDRLLLELREGEIRRGRITSVRPFGVFVDLGGADGLAHLSELTWERGKSPEEMYSVGQEVDVFVMKVDPETKKIALSLRRAQPQRWHEIVDDFRIGQIVPGRVTKLVTFGAFARIDGPVEGLIHVSELSDRRIQHPREVVHEGDIVPLKVLRVERDKERIALSLRQARDDAERQGWEFDANGSVISFPEHLRGEIEGKLGAGDGRTTGREERAPRERQEQASVDAVPEARESRPVEAREPREQRQSREQREPREPREPRDQRRGQATGAAPPDEAPVSAFEALRGFVSEADQRREAEEAAGATAAQRPVAPAAEAVASAPIADEAPASGGEQPTPAEEVAEMQPEGAITAPETAAVEAEAGGEEAGEESLPPSDQETPTLGEPAAGQPEGTITGPSEPAEAAAAGVGPNGSGTEPEPPPDGVSSRPEAAARGEGKAEMSQ